MADLETVALIRADRDGWWIGGCDVPVAVDNSAAAHVEAQRQLALGWLVWDLHFGVELGVPDYFDLVNPSQMARIGTLAQHDKLVAGPDIYPISVTAGGGERPDWTPPEVIRLATAEIERWHDRYDHPFWIAETSNLSLPVDQQFPGSTNSHRRWSCVGRRDGRRATPTARCGPARRTRPRGRHRPLTLSLRCWRPRPGSWRRTRTATRAADCVSGDRL